MDDRTKLDYAQKMLCVLLNVGVMDLEAIYQMEENHHGTIDLAFEHMEDFKDEDSKFWLFVWAVRDVSIDEVRDIITEEDAQSFQDMILDNNYAYWGDIASFGFYEGEDVEENRERQELFAEYVKGTITKEEFAKKYKQLLNKAQLVKKHD
jgi:hypothetical protein